MTKRERQYHRLKYLFKYSTVNGTIGVSPSAPFITIANIEKAIAQIKASKPEPPNHILEIVSWDSQEAVKAREDFRYASFMGSFDYFAYKPLSKNIKP